MPIDVKAIAEQGWQQGSLFSPDASRSLLGESYPKEDSRLILASQDCDIVHRGNGEPFIDAFIATPIGKMSSLEMKARNARRLHVPLRLATGLRPHEVLFWSRTVLPREVLTEHAPDSAARLDVGHLRWFQQWLGSRYDRPALPDAFNARLAARDARTAIRTLLEPCKESIQDIFLQIDPHAEELQDGIAYGVRVALIMSAYDAGQPEMVDAALKGRTELESFLRTCPDLDVQEVEIMTDTEFTLADLESYRTWDYTDLSLSSEVTA